MLPDHYTKTLVGSVVDQAVYKALIKIHVPNIDAILEKLYLDTSVFSVPWFLCLFLNSVALPVAIKFLDSFFLEGPKFLFWIAVGILKVNEEKLLSRGKDDDIFMAVLKDFFTRLGLADSEEITDPKLQDISVMTGKPLYDLLMNTACNMLGPHINNEVIESLRIQHRLKVVHQMEDTNRKSQIRTLSEQVVLNFDEIGIVYDQIRSMEYAHDQEVDDPTSVISKTKILDHEREEYLRVTVASFGGWGLVQRALKPIKSTSLQKTITLADFQKVFKKVSQLRHDSRTTAMSPVLVQDSQLSIAIVDRIYLYCAFQYNYIQKQKKVVDPGFTVDLAALVHALDTIMKQQLHTRLRFLFDLHDMDGDGFLSNNELKQAMDSLLEIFQKSNQTDPVQAEHDEEVYLKAVSSFLAAALQMGNIKANDIGISGRNEDGEFDLTAGQRNPGKSAKSKIIEVDTYRLSFNEFLLAILSQSVFVEYFERKWNLGRQGEVIVVNWQKDL